MDSHSAFSGTRTGTACGTLLVILSTINIADLIQTSLVAAVGATVSFIVTLIWKRVFARKKK